MLTRRNLLCAGGALIAAPFVARAGVLMPVRRLGDVVELSGWSGFMAGYSGDTLELPTPTNEGLIDVTRDWFINVDGHQSIRIPAGTLQPGQQFTLNVRWGREPSSLTFLDTVPPKRKRLRAP